MDLTVIPGIGPAYGERLQAAGVGDVPDLALAEDLDALHEATGIPVARLEAFRDEARRLAAVVDADDDAEPDLGIATQGISHDVGETLKKTMEDVRVLAAARWRDARAHVDDWARRLPGRRGSGHA